MNACWTSMFLGFVCSAPPSPPAPPTPVLFVKIIAPDGATATFHPGLPNAVRLNAPVVVGVRPGYIYRFQLDGFAEDPRMTLTPSVEVRAGLFVPVNLRASDYPAPITITRDDVRRIASGGMVTKVVYLENPETAPAAPTTPNQPLEHDVVTGEDIVDESRLRGRPLMIVRIGNRVVPPEELAALDIAGTLLLPGETSLPPAAQPPTLPMVNFPWFDPRLGPKLNYEELLPDGGDVGDRTGIGPDGTIGGLDATDTAMEFRQGNGRRRTTVSNRVCLFAPRFGILKQDHIVGGTHLIHNLGGTETIRGPQLAAANTPHVTVDNMVVPRSFVERETLRGIRVRVGPHSVDNLQGKPLVIGRVDGLELVSGAVEPLTAIQLRDHCKPEEPLVLVKMAEPREALPGDEVTFTLKYINYGGKVVRDLAVVDNLASRLEYIPGSSQADREVVFTMRPNEAGSLVLRWEVAGELRPGESGVVKFKVKVR